MGECLPLPHHLSCCCNAARIFKPVSENFRGCHISLQDAPNQAVASTSAPSQTVASTSAPSGMEETEQSQLTLLILLDTIVESYESQQVQLADACRQIDKIILSTENLTDSQRNALRDWYIASVED